MNTPIRHTARWQPFLMLFATALVLAPLAVVINTITGYGGLI